MCIVKCILLFFHNSTLSFAQLPRGRSQRILEEDFNGSRIVELLLTDRVGLAAFQRVAELMNRDLGQDKPLGRATSGVSTRHNNVDRVTEPPPQTVPDEWRVFLHVQDSNQQVCGCAIVEVLTQQLIARKNYKIRPLRGGRQGLLSWALQRDLPCAVAESSKEVQHQIINGPICGVRRLWVSKTHRRHGIATRLLNCVLSNVVFGRCLQRSQVAFSDPTGNGADFAVSFVGEEEFLTY